MPKFRVPCRFFFACVLNPIYTRKKNRHGTVPVNFEHGTPHLHDQNDIVFPRTGNGASFISAPLAFTLNPSIFLFKMAEKNQNSGCLLPVFKFKPHRTKPTVLGTFSSDDDHVSENVRKQSVLINKTLALHVRYQLWFISLSAMQCVSNACALIVTAAKLILPAYRSTFSAPCLDLQDP